MSSPRNSKRPVPADQDSLVAMDALLQIGQGSESSIKSSSKHRIIPLSDLGQGSRDELVKKRLTESTNHLAATINSLLPVKAVSMFSQSGVHHFAAITAAQSVASSPSWTGVRGNGGGGMASALSHFYQESGLRVSPEMSFPAREASGLFGHSSNVTVTRDTGTARVRDGSDSIGTSSSVRMEKVEAALRSKPQRGRKRDDLSENERVELTRTRNREHAKCTRIRKKARYQELLDREEAYLKMLELEKLQSERIGCILKLISLRRKMLLDHFRCVPDVQESDELASRSPQHHTESRASNVADNRQQLSELVLDVSSFEFDSLLPGGASADSDEALAKMLEWDGDLASRLMHSFGSDISKFSSSLTFEIESGVDGIAQSNSDHAFCRLELFVILPSAQSRAHVAAKSILSGICSFRFGAGSSRLVSMQWTSQDDRSFGGFLSPMAGASNGASHPPLEAYRRQLVHPSVVSLEHVRGAESDETHCQGVGMSI